jgi:hypothetical protein
MSNVIRTRRNQYLRPQSSQQQIPSASRPAMPSDQGQQSVEIEEQQKEAYTVYHNLCRRALAQYFHEDPDRNWNYVDHLRRIWEAGNTMASILSPEMRVKLTSDRLANSAIRKLYNHYDTFPINITDNFETLQRHVIRPRVSFHSKSGHREFNETSASRQPIQSTQSTPRNISSIREPRLSVASTSNITMSRGAPRPSARRSLAAPSPTPFEESARTLNSLVEPAEGEY